MQQVPLEDFEIEEFANYLRANQYKFSNVMNEFGIPSNILGVGSQFRLAIKKLSGYIGAKRSKHGVSAGVPDFFIVWEGHGMLWVEMKRQKPIGKRGLPISSPSKVSPEQIEWTRIFNTIPNMQAVICYGAKEAIEWVEHIDRFFKENEKKIGHDDKSE